MLSLIEYLFSKKIINSEKKIINLEIKLCSSLINLHYYNCNKFDEKKYEREIDGYICNNCKMDWIYNDNNCLVYQYIFSNEYQELDNSYIGISMKDYRKMIVEMDKETAIKIIENTIDKNKFDSNKDLPTLLDELYNDLKWRILLHVESHKIYPISKYKFF